MLPLLDPEERVVIGESATRLVEGEPLLHPRFLSLLQRVRRALPKAPLQVTTNGLLLTEPLQRALVGLAPIELVVSVNSLDPSQRKLWLGDPQPERTLAQLEALGRNGLTFQASFVLAPPFLDQFPSVLRRVETWGAAYVRLLLPGGSRLTPVALQGSWDSWCALSEQIRLWREEVSIPCVLEPPLLFDLQAEVEGVLPNSPAVQAGLQPGDRIERIDGKAPFSRQDAFQAIAAAASPHLTVLRRGQRLEVRLEKEANQRSGLVFSRDITRQSLERTLSSLPVRGRGLTLTGELALPILRAAWKSLDVHLPLVAVPNRTFGGSIRAAGLLTLADMRATLEELAAPACPLSPSRRQEGIGRKWDWLLLPATPFEEGCDLCGASLADFERDAGVPVFLAES